MCGDQSVLVEEILDTVRAVLAPAAIDAHSFTAGIDADRDIWAAAHQCPYTVGANRLIVVRDADGLRVWEPLRSFLTARRTLPTSHLVLASGEAQFPAASASVAPVWNLIKTRGQVVRCGQPNDRDLLAWTRRRGGIDEQTAHHLITRTAGQVPLIAAVCAKLQVLHAPGRAAIDALCADTPALSFVDSLLARRKPDALIAGALLSDHEITAAISLLDTRIDLLGSLHRSSGQPVPVDTRTQPPSFLTQKYLPLCGPYHPGRCVYARRVLAVLDNAVRSGARTGVVEALVALW